MSRFDELDHRIGRHDEVPNPNCGLCDPSLAVNVEPEPPGGRWWDYEQLVAPPFPDWGTFWKHRGDVLVFVNPNSGEIDLEKTAPIGGFWMDTKTAITGVHGKPIPSTRSYSRKANSLSLFPHADAIQMELGSGVYAGRVAELGTKNTVPNEAALSSPLGVDLAQWAAEQNYAKLIADMDKKRLFPVSEVWQRTFSDHSKDTTVIASFVRVVEIPADPTSYQMTMPF